MWNAAALPNRCAAFSPDGQWLATGDRDGAVTLWEMASAGRVRRSQRGHTAGVSGVSFHANGSRLVSSSYDGRVKVWDWRAGVDLLTLPPPGWRHALARGVQSRREDDRGRQWPLRPLSSLSKKIFDLFLRVFLRVFFADFTLI